MEAERSHTLLGANDPPPVRITNPSGRASFLLTGDHAGVAIPEALGTLGLSPHDLSRHIACDIGVAELGRKLAHRMDACFVEQQYSRLVIDCNRAPGRDDSIPPVSDGTAIPGNFVLESGMRSERVRAIHAPYQTTIETILAERDRAGRKTILIALHSFTPVMAGMARPWDIGVLHAGGDTTFAIALLNRLYRMDGMTVGDNNPYRMDDTDHTVPLHAYAARRPYAELEIRQDHLSDAAGQDLWAGRLTDALRSAMRS